MLINGRQGVLSIGGTGAPAVDLVVKQTKDQLDRVGALERGETLLPPTVEDAVAIPEGAPLAKRGRAHTRIIETREASWKDGWEWSTVQGAEGWWQILMQGVWVDGTKVLQNQAAVVDVCLGMILCSSEALGTNLNHRSIARSSSHLLWLLKLFTPRSPARIRCQRLIRIFTSFLASILR